MDFNCDGKYLAGVYENGLVNIFNTEQNIRVKRLSDGDGDETILARFHPTRQMNLVCSTFKGKVSVVDLTVSKIIFKDRNAHDAPCREVAMPEDVPDLIFSCGCDSIIKIYDMRKKSTGLQIQSHCGFSTISSSKCGGFFAVGNLKGDLMTYDLRDLKKPLTMTKGDGDLITRVAFLPNFDDSNSIEPSLRVSAAYEELPEPPEDQNDFSINDILEINQGRVSDFDFNSSSRVSAIPYMYANDERRGSELFSEKLASAFRDISFTVDEASNSPAANNLENMKRAGKRESRRRSSYLPSPLQLIHEEHSDKENHGASLNTPNSTGPRFSSTPTVRFNLKVQQEEEEEVESSEEIIDVDAIDSIVGEAETVENSNNHATAAAAQSDFKQEFESIRQAIRFEIQSLNFDLNGRHMEMMTYIYNQRRNLENRIKVIEECMAFMMNDDAKIARVMELQEENRDLRQQLNEIMSKLIWNC